MYKVIVTSELTITAPNEDKAEEIAEKEVSKIKGPLFHRKDIGTTELIQKKINNMHS